MWFSFALPLLMLVISTLCSAAEKEGALQVLDIQELRLVRVEAGTGINAEDQTDLLIVGAGLGGIAAALAACESGRSVILTEETDWLGGQISAQGVSVLDENYWVEKGGSTLRYQKLRDGIRAQYLDKQRSSSIDPNFSPGNAWAGRLAFEPAVGVAVIESILRPHEEASRLRILRRHKAIRVERHGDRIESIDILNLETLHIRRVHASFFLDATELGDLLPLAEMEYTVGAESKAETDEPHALEVANPNCSQSFTYPFILERGRTRALPLPIKLDCDPLEFQHRFNDSYKELVEFAGLSPNLLTLYDTPPGAPGSLWTYRRLIKADLFEVGAYEGDLSLINLPVIDYRMGNLLNGSPQDLLEHLRAAKSLSLCFYRWLHASGPRLDGESGYPELRLRTDLLGSSDGLSLFPYIRESRRIKALTTVREQDVSAAVLEGKIRGRFFRDSVGIGFYGFDIHPGQCDEGLPDTKTRPFQIPLGALIPVRIENLLPACKNIGTTHITSSCYRLHPIEWAVGEAVGTLAAECLDLELSLRELYASPKHVLAFQRKLVNEGVPIYWYADIGVKDDLFKEAQLAPFLSEEARGSIEEKSCYR